MIASAINNYTVNGQTGEDSKLVEMPFSRGSIRHFQFGGTNEMFHQCHCGYPKRIDYLLQPMRRFFSWQDSFGVRNTASRLLNILCGTNRNSNVKEPSLFASINESGQAVVKTKDGWSVKFTGQDMAFEITSPENKTTRIWGDPHVEESDGDKWDFSKQSSFVFGNNKITVETADAGNGATFSSRISIYNGEDRFTISGIDKNQPKIEAWEFDAQREDALLDDGVVYRFENEKDGKETWAVNEKL